MGGGVVVIPFLTLALGIPIKLAIGASIVSIIATSSGAAAAFARDRISNLRIGTFLQVTASLGAITGGLVAGVIPPRALYVIFGLMLAYSALLMLRKRQDHEGPLPPDPVADRLDLHGSFFDDATGKVVTYRVTRSKVALGLMYVAGLASGLLGIGSGVLKVPAMDLVMRLPIKVSSATSNFMIGVTAASSAGIYLFRGDISPLIAGPVAGGIVIGARLGSQLLKTMHSSRVRLVFILVLSWVSIEMLLKGIT